MRWDVRRPELGKSGKQMELCQRFSEWGISDASLASAGRIKSNHSNGGKQPKIYSRSSELAYGTLILA
jgi:hypothetical protein